MTRWVAPVLLVAACAVFLGDAGRVMRPKNAVPHNPGVDKTVQINGEMFYISIDDTDTWYNAKSKCALAGMRLVTLDTPERWQMIEDFMLANPDYDWWTWTAGHKTTAHENFMWETTGENFTHSDWNTFEPSAGEFDEACMDFYAYVGGWDDDPCMYMALQYMCETIPQ